MDYSPVTVCFHCENQNLHRDRSRRITNPVSRLITRLHERLAVCLSTIVWRSFKPPIDFPTATVVVRSDQVLGRPTADQHPVLARTLQFPSEAWCAEATEHLS
jgi:hypothetical protein